MIPPHNDTLSIPPESLQTRLKKTVLRLLQRAGVDRAVLFAVLTRVWQMLVGPLTLLLIARYMTPVMQGFYFTFASILALQSFVELGFYIVIINIASHEWSSLELDVTGSIKGSPEALSRLVSLGRLVFKWYAVASGVFVLIVGACGYIFFSQNSIQGVAWQLPWFVLVFLTGLLLWMLPFNSLLEGCNQVATIQQFRLSQAVMSTFALWLTLVCGGGLWAAAASSSVSVLRDLYLLLVRYRRFFEPFFNPPSTTGIRWRTEIWPMQWRLALSGLVNYFAFSLFNPVMFYYHGAVVAGQMGMTWALTNALQAIALAWIQTKVPQFGVLIARKEYTILDRFFFRTSFVSLVVIIVGAAALWMMVQVLNFIGHPLAQRMLPPLPTGLFILAAIGMQISQCQSAYLRAHRQEPILLLSVTTSLLIGLLVGVLGSQYGALGAASSYLVMVVIIVIWETRIWQRCRREWHQL